MEYTTAVQELVDDPMKGRTPQEAREICSSAVAQHAMAHPPQDFLIEKFCADGAFTPDEARELFDECKRFLIAGQLLDVSLAPSLHVDNMWHAWILFTMDYTEFCNKVGSYIHHRPIPKGNPEQPPLDPTVKIMQAAYGELSDRFWPQELGAFGILDCKKGP